MCQEPSMVIWSVSLNRWVHAMFRLGALREIASPITFGSMVDWEELLEPKKPVLSGFPSYLHSGCRNAWTMESLLISSFGFTIAEFD